MASLGKIARKLGIYGPLRSLKARLDRSRPEARARIENAKPFYGQFIHHGDTVFDVGANNGNRAEIFLALDAKVVAVEPQPGCQKVLHSLFGRDPRFTLEGVALGDAPGTAKLHLASDSVLATLSSEWIERAKQTRRYGDSDWSDTVEVPVTTLDQLIQKHGEPAFCKIDVEGFEEHVISGLSKPVKALSLEVVHEEWARTMRCVDRLAKLATYECNISVGESLRFDRGWVPMTEAHTLINAIPAKDFGDLYLRRVG